MAPLRRGPRPRDAEATRRALLGAATAVFAEHGFAGARVDEIARRAGVNKRMIYAYYGDKEGLYHAVLSSRLAAPKAATELAASADPRKALEDLVRWWFRLLAEDPAFARLLAWDLLSGRPRGRDVLLDSAAPTLDLVEGLVRRAAASGALHPGLGPELFRTAVIALCLGYALQRPAIEARRARTGRPVTDAEFVEVACRLLFAAGEGGAGGPPRRRG